MEFIHSQPTKVQNISDFPQLRTFLGLINFYHRFISTTVSYRIVLRSLIRSILSCPPPQQKVSPGMTLSWDDRWHCHPRHKKCPRSCYSTSAPQAQCTDKSTSAPQAQCTDKSHDWRFQLGCWCSTATVRQWTMATDLILFTQARGNSIQHLRPHLRPWTLSRLSRNQTFSIFSWRQNLPHTSTY